MTTTPTPRKNGQAPRIEPLTGLAAEGTIGSPDPYEFDLADFELDPSEVEMGDPGAGVFAVGRPGRQVFFRSKPDFSCLVRMIELKDGGEGAFLLAGSLAKAFEEEAKPRELRLLQTRFGGYMLYPLGLPDRDGRLNPWTASARMAVQEAETRCIRMVSDRALGQYLTKPARDQEAMPPVSWPTLSRQEILERAFGLGNLIAKPDHPVLLRLQGLRSV